MMMMTMMTTTTTTTTTMMQYSIKSMRKNVKGLDVPIIYIRHLYSEKQTEAVYNLKRRTDQH